ILNINSISLGGIFMSNNPTLITGTITDENNKYVSKAVIQLVQIDKNLNVITDLGFTLSDINGKYQFVIEAYSDMFYEFT
ncbi:MAG TPA: hypothetical protein DDY58_04815, partial [Terrisporobacter glycolicus]|nr:hypothetical protein [Terrisporobacter hibernicus]